MHVVRYTSPLGGQLIVTFGHDDQMLAVTQSGLAAEPTSQVMLDLIPHSVLPSKKRAPATESQPIQPTQQILGSALRREAHSAARKKASRMIAVHIHGTHQRDWHLLIR